MQKGQKGVELPGSQVHADPLEQDDGAGRLRQFLQLLNFGGVQSHHSIALGWRKVAAPLPDDFREVRIDPFAVRLLDPQAPAVQPTADVQNEGVRVECKHPVGPVVEDSGPHRHKIGQPPRFCLSGNRKGLLPPDFFRLLVAEDEPFLAHLRLAVKRDKQRFVDLVHRLASIFVFCALLISLYNSGLRLQMGKRKKCGFFRRGWANFLIKKP